MTKIERAKGGEGARLENEEGEEEEESGVVMMVEWRLQVAKRRAMLTIRVIWLS